MTAYYVTTTGAGAKDGAAWATAFSWTEFATDMTTNAVAGDTYYFKEGSYSSITIGSCTRSGAGDNYIEMIGVKSATTNEPPVASDWADTTARPLITFTAANRWVFTGDYILTRNLRITGSYATDAIFELDDNSQIENCYTQNTAANATARAFDSGINVKVIDCEFEAASGIGMVLNTNAKVLNCYIHDCAVTGILVTSGAYIHGCIVDTCGTGLAIEADISDILYGNTVYNCTTGILASSTTYTSFFLNNTISDCTDGFKNNNAGTIDTSLKFDYNNWYNNTHDMSWDNGSSEDNAAKGANATALDPEFTDAAGGDFSIAAGSNLANAGFGMRLGVS